MIQSFRGQGTQDVWNGANTKAASQTRPSDVWKGARRRLAALNAATALTDLKMPPSNKLHPLTKDREGQHAIWINTRYRICFRWTENGPEDVEITDYH